MRRQSCLVLSYPPRGEFWIDLGLTSMNCKSQSKRSKAFKPKSKSTKKTKLSRSSKTGKSYLFKPGSKRDRLSAKKTKPSLAKTGKSYLFKPGAKGDKLSTKKTNPSRSKRGKAFKPGAKRDRLSLKEPKRYMLSFPEVSDTYDDSLTRRVASLGSPESHINELQIVAGSDS